MGNTTKIAWNVEDVLALVTKVRDRNPELSKDDVIYGTLVKLSEDRTTDQLSYDEWDQMRNEVRKFLKTL